MAIATVQASLTITTSQWRGATWQDYVMLRDKEGCDWRKIAFGLNADGVYEAIAVSQVLTGLPIELVAQTLERLADQTNTAAANWFMQQLQKTH